MANLRLLLVVTLLLAAAVFGDDKAKKNQLDTMDSKLDTLLVIQRGVHEEVTHEPLAGRRFGIEVNPLRLLFLDEETSISGGVSLFSVDRSAEVAFPWFYAEADDGSRLRTLTIDAHYRQFLGRRQNGFYLSAFTRFAYLSGLLGSDYWFGDAGWGEEDTESKLGIGFGLGWRKFSDRGLYWGVSLSMGRFLIGDNDKFRGDLFGLDNDDERIFDMEFFKFGWAF